MIVIAPYSKKLMNGKENPKNYPYWSELIKLINDPIVQIGVEGETRLVRDFRINLPITELRELIKQCRTWIGVDSFFQHLAWTEGKKGIVLWSVSDPLIFGHPENVNLLKSRSYLSDKQFLWWEDQKYEKDAFIDPHLVIENLKII
jgi:ADP-heptose:LPS heptosyltransferase